MKVEFERSQPQKTHPILSSRLVLIWAQKTFGYTPPYDERTLIITCYHSNIVEVYRMRGRLNWWCPCKQNNIIKAKSREREHNSQSYGYQYYNWTDSLDYVNSMLLITTETQLHTYFPTQQGVSSYFCNGNFNRSQRRKKPTMQNLLF